MQLFSDFPFVPIIALVLIVPLVSWQIYNYWLERKRNQKPNIPDINKNSATKTNSTIKNATLLKALKPKAKVSRKTSLLFTSALGIFVLVNVLILTVYLRNRKLTYLPRADEIITPTSSVTTTAPLPSPVLTITPLPSISLYSSPTITQILPSLTIKPTLKITALPTMAPSRTPTTVISQKPLPPTVKPTVLAKLVTTLTPTIKASPTPIIASIPETGIATSSLLLAGLSLIFLVLGLAL